MLAKARPLRSTPAPRRIAGLWALALAVAATVGLRGPAAAQSASDFRLQPGAGPKVQGPVDPDNPAVSAQSPRPAPQPAPVPSLPDSAPSAAPPAAATGPAAPSGEAPAAAQPPARQDSRAATRAGSAAEPPPTGIATPAAAPVTEQPAIPLPPLAGALATPTSAETTATPAQDESAGSIPWWWLLPAAGLGALGTFGAWTLLARRRARELREPAFIPPRPVTADPPAPAPKPAAEAPAPAAAATIAAATAALQTEPDTADPLELVLEPVRFSVTLMNATLQYRLHVANRSAAPLGPLAIAADMIAAHASLPETALLAQDGSALELRHEVPALAPGESVELKGDLRLPLASVAPIRAGSATLLVPLVRLRTEGTGPVRTTALVVGEPSAGPDGRLRPFRLDQGPRIFGAVSQRALATAA